MATIGLWLTVQKVDTSKHRKAVPGVLSIGIETQLAYTKLVATSTSKKNKEYKKVVVAKAPEEAQSREETQINTELLGLDIPSKKEKTEPEPKVNGSNYFK